MAPPRPLHVTARSTPTTTTARISAYSTNVWPCSLRTRVSRRSTRDIRNLPVTRFGALHPLARRCSRRRAPTERTKGRTELDHQTSLPGPSRAARADVVLDSSRDGVDRRLDRIAQSAPRSRKQNAHDDHGQDQCVFDERLTALVEHVRAYRVNQGHHNLPAL